MNTNAIPIDELICQLLVSGDVCVEDGSGLPGHLR